MNWLWIGLTILAVLIVLAAGAWTWLYQSIKRRLFLQIVRIFQEKPLFIIPRGQPIEDADEVKFPTEDGLTLRGLYLRTTASQRQGVILFGLEFGSNRWSCVPYCQFLREAGFDIFTFESRNQGESEGQPGYEPLQWITDYEIRDMRAALAHLKGRADADPRGVGFFGISKGGGAGLFAAADDDYVRCMVTDGVFATHTTMLPYMRKWIMIYSDWRFLQRILPDWYYLMFANMGLRHIERERGCTFPHLEREIRRLAPRPWLMIHGGADNYIKPEMARALFELAREPKELWIVEGAKHNQAFQVANGEYQRRVLAFFRSQLSGDTMPEPRRNGRLRREARLTPVSANHE